MKEVALRRWFPMESKEPDIIYCQKSDKNLYDALADEDIFKGLDLKHIFIMAMVLGFRENKREKIQQKEPGGLFRVSYLNDTEKALIKSIAVSTENGNLEVLLDKKKVYSIAEEYANGGLRLLKNLILIDTEKIGSFNKILGGYLLEEVNKISKNESR